MSVATPEVVLGIIPYIFYRDVPAAIEFLTRCFGFMETSRHGTPSGSMHAEMAFRGQRIMLGQGAKAGKMLSAHEAGVATQGVFIYLTGIDAHYAQAKASGARIDRAVEDLSYGRSYTAYDLDDHPWFFTTPPKPV